MEDGTGESISADELNFKTSSNVASKTLVVRGRSDILPIIDKNLAQEHRIEIFHSLIKRNLIYQKSFESIATVQEQGKPPGPH